MKVGRKAEYQGKKTLATSFKKFLSHQTFRTRIKTQKYRRSRVWIRKLVGGYS